jgi:DNA-binding MurR/RpiR family transcriptional regulator
MIGSVRQKLSESLAGASKADKAIASYMLAQLNGLAFETAASIAGKVAVSEPTVGRFCRSLGYASFKDLKDHLKQDLGDRPWLISDRLRDLQRRTLAGEDQLARGLQLEIAGLVAVYELAHTPEWKRVIKRLATTPAVFVTGFQTERGVAQTLVNQLQYLRDRVHLIDLAGGNFIELLASDSRQSCLVLFEAKRYSRMARLLAYEAKKLGIPTTLITDAFCDWGRELVDEMFVVPTEFNLFWESTAQMASLVNLLVNGVFIEIGPEVENRMNEISRLYSAFTGYVGDPSGPSVGELP